MFYVFILSSVCVVERSKELVSELTNGIDPNRKKIMNKIKSNKKKKEKTVRDTIDIPK